jgi:hypothetical protein
MWLDFEQNVSAGMPMRMEPQVIRLRHVPQECLIALTAFATVQSGAILCRKRPVG